MTQHESDTAAQSESEADASTPVSAENDNVFDDDSDIEDLEFLIDDIEDQIAPLG